MGDRRVPNHGHTHFDDGGLLTHRAPPGVSTSTTPPGSFDPPPVVVPPAQPPPGSYADTFDGNASQTDFILSHIPDVGSVKAFVDGLRVATLSVSGSVIHFATAPASGSNNVVIDYTSQPVTAPPAPVARATYGSAIELDTKANIQVGGGDEFRVAHRFRAPTSSPLRSVRFSQRGGPDGYSSQNGASPTLTISVQRDDGSGNPSGTAIASITYVPANPVGEWTRYDQLTFGSPPALVSGELYHIVFVNNNPGGGTWISVNEVFVYDGPDTPRQPFTPDTDDAVLDSDDAGVTWTLEGKYTAVMDLTFADGSHAGQAYTQNMIDRYGVISGTSDMVRETFIVSGGTRSVSGVAVRVRRTSGTDDLVVRLEQVDGTEIESVTISHTDVPITPPGGDDGGSVWVTAAFSGGPYDLDNGSGYNVRLSCAGTSEYTAACIRDGLDVGFGSYAFRDGSGQRTTDGSSWSNLYLYSPVDIQFYLTVV